MRKSLIIITYNRVDDLRLVLSDLKRVDRYFDEVLVIDNNSSDSTSDLFAEYADNEKYHTYKLERNLGVAGGRNFGVQKATGDLLFFLDDDAFFSKDSDFSKIEERFLNEPNLGILSFRIKNYYSNEIRSEEFPSTDKTLDSTKEFKTSYYIGAGHVIRREIFEICGDYPEDYFYGKEELDLSIRALDQNYEIIYYPNVTVLHKQSLGGRMPNQKKWIQVYRNRLIISYKYFPINYHLISGLLWFAKIALVSKSLSAPIIGLFRFTRDRKKFRREIIKPLTVKYLKGHYGRLYY